MGNSRSTFAKNERDRNKKARKAAKIEERRMRREGDDDADHTPRHTVSAETQEAIIEKLRILHEDYENEKIDDETFEETKAELLDKLAAAAV